MHLCGSVLTPVIMHLECLLYLLPVSAGVFGSVWGTGTTGWGSSSPLTVLGGSYCSWESFHLSSVSQRVREDTRWERRQRRLNSYSRWWEEGSNCGTKCTSIRATTFPWLQLLPHQCTAIKREIHWCGAQMRLCFLWKCAHGLLLCVVLSVWDPYESQVWQEMAAGLQEGAYSCFVHRLKCAEKLKFKN